MTMINYIPMAKTDQGPKERCKQIVSLCWALLISILLKCINCEGFGSTEDMLAG